MIEAYFFGFFLPLLGFGILASVYGILAYLFNWE
jgi:hypothetical protein